MTSLAGLLGFLFAVQNAATALVFAAFFALGLRSGALIALDQGRRRLVVLGRSLAAVAFVGLGALYFVFTAHVLVWNLAAAGTALLALALAGLSLLVRRWLPPRPPGLVGVLLQLVLLLCLLLLATLTLMRAGFLALTADRPVLLVDVTGETLPRLVRWAPPDQAMREEALATHHVVFKTPEGATVAEAWVYGDQVAVKGRVLRLSPLLNAAGVPNLFELQFAHNGYLTAERHNAYPHAALPLPPTGPLAVHPWWRPLQGRLLERWERGTADGSGWAVRSATIESTYFPLVDMQGKPVRKTFRLVMTPGGLSSS